MPAIILGNIKIDAIESGGTVNYGDALCVSPKSTVTIQGGSNSETCPIGDYHSFHNNNSGTTAD